MTKKKDGLLDLEVLVQYIQNNDQIITKEATLQGNGKVVGGAIKDASNFSKDVRVYIPVCPV